jgi:hypothetical protein
MILSNKKKMIIGGVILLMLAFVSNSHAQRATSNMNFLTSSIVTPDSGAVFIDPKFIVPLPFSPGPYEEIVPDTNLKQFEIVPKELPKELAEEYTSRMPIIRLNTEVVYNMPLYRPEPGVKYRMRIFKR